MAELALHSLQLRRQQQLVCLGLGEIHVVHITAIESGGKCEQNRMLALYI